MRSSAPLAVLGCAVLLCGCTASATATPGTATAAAVAAPATPSTTTPPGVTSTFTKAVFDPIQVVANTPDEHWRAQLMTHGRSDVYVVHNIFPPHTETGWHTHPGPSLIQVVKGTVTDYEGAERGCAPHVYTAGQGFVDAGGSDVHILRNETDAAAETVVVQVLPTDATRKTTAPAPANCPTL